MKPRVPFLACLACLVLPSAAGASQSVYQRFPETRSELAAGCTELNPISAADRKRYGYPDVEGTFSCAGYLDYRFLRKTNMMTSVQFGYLSKAIEETYFESFVEENTVGDTIEWRLDERGVPRAAIVRYRFGDVTNPDGTREPADSILVVSKVGQPDDPVGCAVGLVNAGRNRNANEIARRVADEVTPGFVCGSDLPAYHGADRSGPPIQTEFSDD
jgi:hypothetical protein